MIVIELAPIVDQVTCADIGMCFVALSKREEKMVHHSSAMAERASQIEEFWLSVTSLICEYDHKRYGVKIVRFSCSSDTISTEGLVGHCVGVGILS
jgi:hypothetical protein